MNAQSILLPILMIGALYLVMVRPQQRRLKQHRALVSAIKPGDEVVTVGGMYGHVKNIDDATVWLEVADGMVIRFSRQAISRNISPPDAQEGVEGEAQE